MRTIDNTRPQAPRLAIHDGAEETAPPPAVDMPKARETEAEAVDRSAAIIERLDRTVSLLERIASLVAVQATSNAQEPRAMMTRSELAELLGKDYRTVQRMEKTGKLPAPKLVGREYRFERSQVEAWLAAGCPDRETWKAMKGE